MCENKAEKWNIATILIKHGCCFYRDAYDTVDELFGEKKIKIHHLLFDECGIRTYAYLSQEQKQSFFGMPWKIK